MVTTTRTGDGCSRSPPRGRRSATSRERSTSSATPSGRRPTVVVVPVERLSPAFFELRSGVAGAIVQKFVNYRLRLVVVGDPAHHGPTSGPVDDWIREANRGRDLWFVADEDELDAAPVGS